jgi:hypothetical protein
VIFGRCDITLSFKAVKRSYIYLDLFCRSSIYFFSRQLVAVVIPTVNRVAQPETLAESTEIYTVLVFNAVLYNVRATISSQHFSSLHTSHCTAWTPPVFQSSKGSASIRNSELNEVFLRFSQCSSISRVFCVFCLQT